MEDSGHSVDGTGGLPGWLRAAAGVVLGVAFIAFVEWYVGWRVLLRPWLGVPTIGLVAAAALALVTQLMRAMRVHDYFGAATRGRRCACTRLVLRHTMLNNLLPMRAGELAFPVLMARDFRVAAAESLPGLLWFRLLDLHAIALCALLAFAGGLLPTPVAVLTAALWLTLPWFVYRAGRRLGDALSGRLGGRSGRLLERLLRGLPQTHRVFWPSLGWTLLNWGLKLAVFAWVLSLFAPVTPGAALLGAIGGELTSVLPIHSLAGMGTYEAGVVAALLPSGLSPEQLLRAAVNLHIFMLGVTLVSGGLALLVKCPGDHGPAVPGTATATERHERQPR